MEEITVADHRMKIDRELKKMCQLKTRQLSTLCFFAGSSVEIPDPPTCRVHDDFFLERANDDVDMMFYSTNINAFNQSKQVPSAFVGEIKRIQTETIHPGYALLVNDKDGLASDIHATLINFAFESLQIHSTTQGPASRTDLSEMFRNPFRVLNIDRRHNNFRVGNMEAVFAVHSPCWPNEALEWVTRTRKSGFPKKRLIRQIVKYGCDFVNVSPKNEQNPVNFVSNGETERDIFWRFSFSMAEYMIIHKWTTEQRIVYRALRCIHKIMQSQGKSAICTYHFKTLMLWECEQKPVDLWHSNSLGKLVKELLEEMVSCLNHKRCKNYFIPANNMMEHLTVTEIETSRECLQNILKEAIHLKVLQHSTQNEELMRGPKTHNQIELPSWLYRSLVVIDYVLNSAKRIATFDTNDFPAHVQAVLKKELVDVCNGLYFQRKSTSRSTEQEAQGCIALSKMHLTRATRLFESSETYFLDLPAEPRLFSGLIWLTKFIFNKTSYDRKYTEISAGHSDIFHPMFVTRLIQLAQERQNMQLSLDNQGAHNSTTLNANFEVGRLYSVYNGINMQTLYEGFVPNFPGFMPTVSLSWFVAKAYLANLMYTTNTRNYAYMLRVCNEIMTVYRQSMLMHPFFADLMLPLSLSTQWTAVYDTDIQNMLGFYALCSFLCNERDCCDVHLGICPIQFSIYLKLRYAIDQSRMVGVYGEKLRMDWSKHIQRCTSDTNANNARIALLVILRNRGVTISEKSN